MAMKWKRLKINSISSVLTVEQLEQTGWTVLGNERLLKACNSCCSRAAVIKIQLMFVQNLHETFPDSMSRASHVRSANEAEGRRLMMAHTCKQRRVTEVSFKHSIKYQNVLRFRSDMHTLINN